MGLKDGVKRLNTIFLGNNILYFNILLESTDLLAVFTKDSRQDKNIEKIKHICSERKIPFYSPQIIKLEKDRSAYELIKKINPDLIVSGGYHLIVPEEIINLPKFGTVNLHQALLPKYRGQHVLQWQIINDEKETGTTLHYMSKKLDDGDIIYQEKCQITHEDTALTIWEKTSKIGYNLLKKFIEDLENNKPIKAMKQDDTRATYYHARKPEDGKINWKSSCKQLFNLARALVQPWPGAFFRYKAKEYIVDKVSYDEKKTDKKPGTIIDKSDKELKISVVDGLVYIKKSDIRSPITNFSEFNKGDILD